MTHDQIIKAITSLRPNAEWTLVGDDYENINWISTDSTKPTLAQIQKEIDNPTISAEVKAREAARQAILDRLGLTADEASLLLGAN